MTIWRKETSRQIKINKRLDSLTYQRIGVEMTNKEVGGVWMTIVVDHLKSKSTTYKN